MSINIPLETQKAERTTEIQQISVELIDKNPYQPRGKSNIGNLRELAESIKQVGILQPLLVSVNMDRFVLIAGHRRLAAAKQAGLTRVPCIIHDLENTDLQRYALIENLQREDLTPLEEAQVLKQLIDLQRLDYRQVAALIGKSKSYVGERLALLDLPGDLKDAVIQGILPLKKAILLKKVSKLKLRAKLIELSASWDLDTLRSEVESLLEKVERGRKPREKWESLPGLKEFTLTTSGVRLYRDRISLQFNSAENLSTLLQQVIDIVNKIEPKVGS